jgi:hypothetical protein
MLNAKGTMVFAVVAALASGSVAVAQVPLEVALPVEVARRDPHMCVLPAQPAYQGRSLWNANLWSGGVVPYEFDANATPAQQGAMRQAMDALEAVAYVHFVARAGQGDYLHIQNDSGNYSYVGEIGGGQTVGIYNWNYRYIMCHELMHALGVWHEQSRPDRDQFITVNYGNIQAGWGSQYDVQGGATPQGVYDFDSVMHYGACDASSCCPAGSSCSCASNCWTMTALPAYAQYQGQMGQRTHLSIGDMAGLASRYGPPTCPVFTQQPAPQAVDIGMAVMMSVSASGAGTPAYRWRHNGADLADDGRIAGAAGSLLTISPVTQADTGLYDCVAANSCGNTTSSTAALTVYQWTVIDLHPQGATASAAFGVGGGQQVGEATVNGVRHASLWGGSAASWLNLYPAGSDYSVVRGVGGGQQVGYVGGDFGHASLWSSTVASWVDLHPAGTAYSYAYGVGGGQQVGAAGGHASLWSGTSGSWVDLHPAGATDSWAFAVGGGQQVGRVRLAGAYHASLWTGSATSWVELNPAGAVSSHAFGVAGGQQVGSAAVGGIGRASLWSGTAASWVDLHPAGAMYSEADAVDAGQQVGYAHIGNSDHASLWSGTSASWLDLQQFLSAAFTQSYAKGISHNGATTYVVGSGFNSAAGRDEALMWLRSVASAPCYANCDASNTPPILNVADFACFLTRYASGDPYANCDNSTQAPVLNVQDFSCFLARYAAGCP